MQKITESESKSESDNNDSRSPKNNSEEPGKVNGETGDPRNN